MGAAKIDFRFKVLQTLVGRRQFKDGISCLKQVTGHDQREIKCYIVAVIADGTKEEVVTAI